MILVLVMLILVATGSEAVAQKVYKANLVFKGIENTNGGWQLKFADKKNKTYFFNTHRSNTEPYIFYSRAEDGGLKVNEKIKNNWFSVSYFILKTGIKEERIITKVETITEPKTESEKLKLET